MSLSNWESQIVQTIPDVTEFVDLLKLPDRRASLQLVIDGECCLDRLYGGYYPDWVCGGQWNKMDQFLCNFSNVVQNSKLDLVVFLNGALESERLNDWCKRQEKSYKFIQEIRQHIIQKRKPPPKIWWIPPAFLRSAIRLAYRCLNMKIMCSLEDHHKEILRFVKKNHAHGIIADDSEYLIFVPDRYFSAQKLKLTFKGSLETMETKLSKLYSAANIPKDRLHIFATLLGNHIVPLTDLSVFHNTLDIPESPQKGAVIEAVSQFVRALNSTQPNDVIDLLLEKYSESSTFDSLEVLRANLHLSLKYYSNIQVKNSGTQRSFQAKSKKIERAVNGSAANDPGTSDITESAAAPENFPTDSEALDSNMFNGGRDGSDGASADARSKIPSLIANGNGSGDAPPVHQSKGSSLEKLIYRVAPQIHTVATNRHCAGLMSPYICQILKHKEIKLPVIIEDVNDYHELPSTHLVFRPLRQRVYAILFNLHHLHFLANERGEPVPSIEVKETYYDPLMKIAKTDVIRAVEIGWGVPTLERLWLGDGDECKRKRVRAFLSVLKSDNQILLDNLIVPQHFLVLCCVLRYLLSDKKILREIEVDGLIAQALIQRLTDVNVAQDIEVSHLTMRGVHIAHMFMEGVEMALLVNDACGSPIPYMLFAPWLFFNGKIFNFILEEQAAGKTIAEICGFKMDIVMEMERIKSATLDGINVQYAPYSNASAVNASMLNAMIQGHFGRVPSQLTQGYLPNGMRGDTLPVRRNAGGIGANPPALQNTALPRPVGRSLSQYGGETDFAYENVRVMRQPSFFGENYAQVDRRVSGRGGQLQVAGTVVGSWGANPPSTTRQYQQGFHGLCNSSTTVRRNPFEYSLERGSNVSVETPFRQMRISPGKNVPNRGFNWNPNGVPSNKSNTKPKKSSMKNNENLVFSGNGSSDDAGTSAKPRVVSFVDEELSQCSPSMRNPEGDEDDTPK